MNYLRMFLVQCEEELPRIVASLTAGDKQEADRISHSLKGAAGTVGATRVHLAVTDLNQAIRKGKSDEEIASCLDALGRELQPLLNGIRCMPG